MQITLVFELQSLISDPNFFSKSSEKSRQSPTSLNKWSLSRLSSPIQDSLLSHPLRHLNKLSSQINVRRPIVSAWNKKRRSGSSRSTKILLQSAYMVASKLKIFPEPLDLLIREICDGNGGGGVFSKGYGGEGSGGRRSRKWNWAVLGILVIIGVALLFAFWKELDLDMAFGVLGLSLFVLSVNVWRRRVLEWVLGFCCCALGGFFFKEDLQRGIKFLETKKIAKRRKRRWF